MHATPRNLFVKTKPNRREMGGALIVVMMSLAILVIIAGTLLSFTTSKQAAPFQAASWHEAGTAAEGGVEIALSALRRSLAADGSTAFGGWVTTPNEGGTTPFAKKFLTEGDLLSHSGEGNTAVKAIVEISRPTGVGTVNPPIGGVPLDVNRQAYVVRATGIANVSGPTRIPLSKPDQALRKLNFFSDFRTKQAVEDGKPRVARVVEAIVAPVTPFPLAILANEQIEIKSGKNMLIDSYDPVDPYLQKSPYNPARKTNATVATNGKKNDIVRLENVIVNGNIAKGGGYVDMKSTATHNGIVIDGFYRALDQVSNPAPAAVPGPSVVPSNRTDRDSIDLDAGSGKDSGRPIAATAYYKVGKIHLHSGDVLRIKKKSGVGGIAVIWVTGDMVIHNGGKIEIDQDVRAIFYVEKNVTLQEKDYNRPAVENKATKSFRG